MAEAGQVKKGGFPVAPKQGRHPSEEKVVRRRLEQVLTHLDQKQFIGYFGSEAALGIYLSNEIHPPANLEAEFSSSHLRDPARYARDQVEIGTIITLSDRHGLWAFNAG